MSELPTTGNPQQGVLQGEVSFDSPPTLPAAAKIVLQDFERCETWLSSKQWALRWRESQLRYEPPRTISFWENTNVPRSSLNVYTVAQIVQSILAKVMEGLFSDDPPFTVTARRSTRAEEARAITHLLHFQTEDCDFRRELEDGAADAVLFGTSIWKANWKECTNVKRFYKRKDQPVSLEPLAPETEPEYLHTEESDDIYVEDKEYTHGGPRLEQQDLTNTYVDPACRRSDIRKAKFVISRITLSADELDEMRDWEGYNIPSEAKLMDLLFPRQDTVEPTQMDSMQTIGNSNANHQAQAPYLEDSADPTQDTSRFEILERWDKDKVIAILNRKLVIRNERHGFINHPYFSVGWWRVPNSFYSMGVGITAGDEQEVQRGLINSLLDEVNWNLNLPTLVPEGENSLTQNLRMSLGKIIKVQDPASVKQMDRLQAVPEGYAEIQASEARAEASSGANELLVQGSMPDKGRTSIGRTATGASLLAGGSGSRLESFVMRLATQVIIPALDMFFEMDKQLLEMEELRQILDDEMFEAYDGDHVDILNARVKFDVLAASQMMVRQRMAQALPMMLQSFLTDPMHTMLTQQGKKLDINELVNMYYDINGWRNKNSLIVDMSPEDQQRAAVQNPAMQKMMVDKAKTQNQTNSKLQILDSDNAARAYREVQRQIIDRELKNSEITGAPEQSPDAFGGEQP